MFIQLLGVIYASSLLSPSHASQPRASQPVPASLRDLPWGQLNFLHTTDTHGWHAGHLQEYVYDKAITLSVTDRKEDPHIAPIGATMFRSHNSYTKKPIRAESTFYS